MKLYHLMRVLPLFAILTIISACSGKTVIFETVTSVCYSPTPPTLTILNEAEHIGSEKNVRLLILNIADLAAYTELLEATLKCYMNKSNAAENQN